MELEQIRKEVARKDRDSLKAARERVSGMRRKLTPQIRASETELKTGDYVRVRTMGKEGYVTVSTLRRGWSRVSIGNMHMRINKDYVEKSLSQPGPREEQG